MAGGRLSCVFTCSVVGLLGVCLHRGVEASAGTRVVHGKTGGTVELSVTVKSGNITYSVWNFEGNDVKTYDQIKDRAVTNNATFSLTVSELTLEDSGIYQFVYDVNNQQGDTVTINLQVHEPITRQHLVTFLNSTWSPTSQSCSVYLECSVATPGDVNFTWTVSGRTWAGPRLQHVLRPEDGDTEFTCTASNQVSQESATISKECRNDTEPELSSPDSLTSILVPLAAAGSSLVMVFIVCTIAAVCCLRRKHVDHEPDDNTLYAYITDVPMKDVPSSLYETVDVNTHRSIVAPPPLTVYDEIQLRRMRKESVSPYQEVN